MLCLWSDQSEFITLFMIFIYGLIQYLFLSFVVNVEFFVSHFTVTTLGLYLFSGTYLNKFLFLWCPVFENSSV